MSMYPQHLGAIPEETARRAPAAFRKGTLAMRLRDVVGAGSTDQDFDQWYPERGQPASTPWRLAGVTLLQYAENLTDRQAAEAVRGRIDGKYCLGLELSNEGFACSVLSEFRQRLAQQGKGLVLLERLLESSQERGWIKAGGKQRTDSTHGDRLACVPSPIWSVWARPCGRRSMRWRSRLPIGFCNTYEPTGLSARAIVWKTIGFPKQRTKGWLWHNTLVTMDGRSSRPSQPQMRLRVGPRSSRSRCSSASGSSPTIAPAGRPSGEQARRW